MKRPLVVLVTGRSGQLAVELQRTLTGTGHRAVALGRPSLDLTSPSSLQAAIASVKPDAVVNAAAYTAVDKAEDEPELAAAINAAGAGALSLAAADAGIPIVHVSTDYVFNGTKEGAYLEQIRRRRSASTAAPSWRGNSVWPRPIRVTSFCGRPGCSARTAIIS